MNKEMNFEIYFITLYPLIGFIAFKSQPEFSRQETVIQIYLRLIYLRPCLRFCGVFYLFDIYAINIQSHTCNYNVYSS